MLRFFQHQKIIPYGAAAMVGFGGFMSTESFIKAFEFIGVKLPHEAAITIAFVCLIFGVLFGILFLLELLKELSPFLQKIRGNKMWSIIIGIIGIVFLVFSIWNFYQTPDQNTERKDNPLDKSIVIECIRTKLPDAMPSSGKIQELSLFYHPENSLKGIGVELRSREAGTKLEWMAHNNEGYRCTVKNYASTPLSDITLKLQVIYMDFIRTEENTWRTGDQLYTQDYIARIPILKGNGDDEFVFYVYNQCAYWANFYPRPTAVIGKIGDKTEQEIEIIVTGGGSMEHAFTLPPYNMDERMKEKPQ